MKILQAGSLYVKLAVPRDMVGATVSFSRGRRELEGVDGPG